MIEESANSLSKGCVYHVEAELTGRIGVTNQTKAALGMTLFNRGKTTGEPECTVDVRHNHIHTIYRKFIQFLIDVDYLTNVQLSLFL